MKVPSRCLIVSFVLIVSLSVIIDAKTIWPKPYSMATGTGVVGLDPNKFTISTTSKSSVLQAAIQRYVKSILFPFTQYNPLPSNVFVLQSMNITVLSDSESLQLGVNENYTLSIYSGDSSGSIEAPTIFGAMRALESFSQLVDFDLTSLTYGITQVPLSIADQPRFPWRGLLIDSARHYLSVESIYRTLDAMSYSKFNTLHWHAVDAESFPVEIDAYPLLAGKGAWAPTATYDQTDIKNVVSYALQRGIRVVMEFDMPGHAYSWGLGYPQLTVTCPSYSSNINNVPLDPTQSFTYQVVESVLGEVASLTTDQYIHVGGDEVVTGCWMQNTNVTSWMKQHGYSNPIQLEQYFENNLKSILKSINRTAVVWEDLYDNGVQLDKSTIIESWSGASTLGSAIKAGYRGITAYGWYLNNQVPIPGAATGQWVDTWKTFYANDPYNGITATAAQYELILGGEAAMWGEQVNSVNYDSRVWPRACAVGERLWSQQGITDLTDATTRLTEHACRLERRGIASGPIKPDYCALPSDVTAYLRRQSRKQKRQQNGEL